MTLVVLLATAGLTLFAAWGRPAVTLGALLVALFALPGSLLLPGTPFAIVTVTRVIEAGAVLGLLRARRRDDVRWPAPMVVVVLLVYVGLTAVTGIGMIDDRLDPVKAAYVWVGQAEMLLVLTLVLGLARRLTAIQVILLVTAGAVLGAGIGLNEWFTHDSWARALYKSSPSQLGDVAAQALERREGHVRVRGAADFALAYGWLLAAAFPVVATAAFALRDRVGTTTRGVLLLCMPAVVTAVVLSRSRSPLLVLVVMATLLLLVLQPQAPGLRILALTGGLVGLAALGPDIVSRLAPSNDAGSVDVRFQRLPDVLALVAPRPYTGTGFTGVERLGPGVVDSSWVQLYVDAGVIAVVLLAIALAVGLLGIARARPAFGERDPDGMLVMGAGLGVITIAVGALAFDAFTAPTTARFAWLLIAVGLAAAERRRGPAALPRLAVGPVLARVALVGVAVAVGVLVRTSAPHHVSLTTVYATLDVRVEVRDQPPGLATTLATTTCQVARAAVQPGQSWRVANCDEIAPLGWVKMTLTGPDADSVERGADLVFATAQTIPGLGSLERHDAVAGAVEGIPTPARVAPAALGTAALALVLVVPGRDRRRRDSLVQEDEETVLAV